jgi:hypothetical protein
MAIRRGYQFCAVVDSLPYLLETEARETNLAEQAKWVVSFGQRQYGPAPRPIMGKNGWPLDFSQRACLERVFANSF